ncbi:MAG TPA: sigma-70 family RNA polymerase sigma factor [Puia sp.]|nr:sigma-70 family RNA polymerase sigma factor [Puia sp.]
MASPRTEADTKNPPAGLFATTRWSVVREAGQSTSPSAEAALEMLCRTYWYPLYAFVRRRGYSPEDAQDLTQEFFFRLLDRGWLHQVDQRKGKFRSFLLVAMKHFLANEWHRARCEKRGGNLLFESLEEGNCEAAFRQEADLTCSPEALYEQRWATNLLETVLCKLRTEAQRTDKLRQFEELEAFLTGDHPRARYAEIAAKLSTTEGALKMATRRLRHRFGELLREEIAQTVSEPKEIEEELRHLLASMSG